MTNLDSGEISAIVAIIGMIFSTLGVSGVDSGLLTGAVNGLVSVVAIVAAVYSWYSHHTKNAS